MSSNDRIKIEALEGLSKDQMEYLVRPLLELLAIEKKTKTSCRKLIDQFDRLTQENLAILKKCP